MQPLFPLGCVCPTPEAAAVCQAQSDIVVDGGGVGQCTSAKNVPVHADSVKTPSVHEQACQANESWQNSTDLLQKKKVLLGQGYTTL